ncbi:hypothetical protein CERZMDRAFT_101855 [Cercospora zeae-maydis SCOH1-5]|uniref:Kinesin motor domain-containing protein n=1 Tax=Cercospora zeae-maydis SCOH1-5 TaxID=717836 RepID=A0A6A6F0K8_9PEZI|nr:hypothetical protein CERZMDRAFT_101855 [Cercospora zeae-maydis SCOH1-5]
MENMKSTSLFDVFLRLRPTSSSSSTHTTINPSTNDTRRKAVETFKLTSMFEKDAEPRDVCLRHGKHEVNLVESANDEELPTHITINRASDTQHHQPSSRHTSPSTKRPTHIIIYPPTNDTRRKAVGTFEYTGVFEEDAQQRDVFDSTGINSSFKGVISESGKLGRGGLLATLGVSGSRKSHTILGDKCRRGLIRLTLLILLDGGSAFMQEQIINYVHHRDQIVTFTISYLEVLRIQLVRDEVGSSIISYVPIP